MMLMFANAMVYNPKGSDVYVMAAVLKKHMMRELEAVLSQRQRRQRQSASVKRRSTSLSSSLPFPSSSSLSSSSP
jgi:hypothetical protein